MGIASRLPLTNRGTHMATSPSLADALADANVDDKRGQVERLLAELPPKDAEVLEAALRGPMSSKRISAALSAIGKPVGRNAIDGWRTRHGVR